MKLFLTCSEDTYITNKIIGDDRALKSNVGRAGTLDLFKLYDENKLRGVGEQTELSRILIKFDIEKLKSKFEDDININSNNFSAKIKLYDITSGNALPGDFNVISYPLKNKFIEGFGRDVGQFSNETVTNFTNRVFENNANVPWQTAGANNIGDFSNLDIDCISTIDAEGLNFSAQQHFKVGNEDLELDVTTSIKSMLLESIPDNGFRLSFVDSEETDTKTRFVKRFASRHVSNPHLRPRLEISYDDSIQDNHLNFVFDHDGTLYLENLVRSTRANIKHNGVELTGEDAFSLRIVSGLFTKESSVSSVTSGTNNTVIPGLYKTSFSISSNEDSFISKNLKVSEFLASNEKIDFKTYWESNDKSQVFHTGSLTIKKSRISSGTSKVDPSLYSVNLASQYSKSDIKKVRLFAIDHSKKIESSTKSRVKKQSEIFPISFYRVFDVDTGKKVFDFGEEDNSTLISSDADGMFFNFDFSILPYGRSYSFEYKIKDGDSEFIIKDEQSRFRVI